VGYSIDSRMKASLAFRAVRNAVRMGGNVNGCIVHPDRGSQFRSRKLRRELAGHNLVGSMGRVASFGDNAAMESFFSLLQKNVLNLRSWDPGKSYASRSWPGSSGPITGDVERSVWAV